MKKLIALLAVIFMALTVTTPASAANAYDTKWGTFATITLSGSGDDVVNLPKTLKAGVIRATHDGEANFIVHSLDTTLETNEYLINEIGQYEADGQFGLGWSSKKTAGFEVQADGNWTITLLPFSKAPAFTGKGTGDGVFRATVKARKALTFKHDGSANFIVHQFCTNGATNYLVNEIGAYSGKKVVSAGTCLYEVIADGNWSIK
jgi:hypothetical protein